MNETKYSHWAPPVHVLDTVRRNTYFLGPVAFLSEQTIILAFWHQLFLLFVLMFCVDALASKLLFVCLFKLTLSTKEGTEAQRNIVSLYGLKEMLQRSYNLNSRFTSLNQIS